VVSVETDVLVVGGGPAGSAAAYHLAHHGVDVLVVDKAAFPREKVCGDGLTPRGVKALLQMGVDPTEPGFTRVEALRTTGFGHTLELPWPETNGFPSYGVVRTRHDLDDLMLRRATSAGARLSERTEAVRPLMHDGWVAGAVLQQEEGEEPREVRARFVVAADGASSRFAGQAGVRRVAARPLGVAARRYFRSPHDPGPFFESWLDLYHEGSYLPGYGWVFPVGDGILNVGAGLLNTFRDFREMSSRKIYEIFLAQVPREWELTEENAVGPILSGPLPMGMNRRPLAVPGLLVAGDAGGFINPFNGEGIAYAIESGQIAAELIHDALVRDRPGLAHVYPAVLRQRYGRYYALGRAFVRAIGRPAIMEASVRYGLPRRRFMEFLFRLMTNLADGGEQVDEKLMKAIVRMAPERR